MGFFDDAYDDMTWEQVCYRLPGEMAVNALKRRITNLDTLRMFFESVSKQPNSVKAIKDHVNDIVSNEDPDDILDMFGEDREQVLFNWLNDDNVKRIRNHDPDKLSLKFLFNCTDNYDRDGLVEVMDRVLQDPDFNSSHLRAVLNKADSQHTNALLDAVIKDDRPEVRVCVLGVGGLSNQSVVSDRYKIIGLKALAKCTSHQPVSSMPLMNIDVFSALKPTERMVALEKYFSYFPRFRKIPAFYPEPSREEFDTVLFAGCLQLNEEVNKLNTAYDEITELDPPETKKDDA